MPFQVLGLIWKAPAGVDSVASVVEDAIARLQLYCGNIHRAVAQERRIGDYFIDLRMKPARSCAITIMDDNMKFEPIRFMETSVEFCSKCGILWHRTVVPFWMENEDHTVGDDLGTLVLRNIAEKGNF